MIKNFIASNRTIHNIASYLVNLLPDFISHNFSKYAQIRKCILNLNYDQILGDYYEFGCFTGASLNHAIRTHLKFSKNKNKINFMNRSFLGFDSFEGFPQEVHPEYTSKNFKSNYSKVKRLEDKYDCCKIIKGYFSDSLKEINQKETNSIAFAFIDCDIYDSSKDIINFLENRLSNGSFLMIDDYYNLDQKGKSIHHSLFENENLYKKLYRVSSYGLNGVIYKYLKN
jgi:O-methyltransferase